LLCNELDQQDSGPGEKGLPPRPSEVHPDTVRFARTALDYLARTGPEGKEAVPALIRIHRRIETLRPQVAVVLEKIGPGAQMEAQRWGVELRGVQAKNQPAPQQPGLQAPTAQLPPPQPPTQSIPTLSVNITPAAFSTPDPVWKGVDSEKTQVPNRGDNMKSIGSQPNMLPSFSAPLPLAPPALEPSSTSRPAVPAQPLQYQVPRVVIPPIPAPPAGPQEFMPIPPPRPFPAPGTATLPAGAGDLPLPPPSALPPPY